MRCELTDFEWSAIKPFSPNKPRGVPQANDRRVLMASMDALKEFPRQKVHHEVRRCGCRCSALEHD